jgi:hypothetical protein
MGWETGPAGLEPAASRLAVGNPRSSARARADELRTRGISALPLSYGPISIPEKCRSTGGIRTRDRRVPITLHLRPAWRGRVRGEGKCAVLYQAELRRSGVAASGRRKRSTRGRGVAFVHTPRGFTPRRPILPSCTRKQNRPARRRIARAGRPSPLADCGGATRAPRRPSRVHRSSPALPRAAGTPSPRPGRGPPGGCCCRIRRSACEGASWVTGTKKEPCPDATVPRPSVDELADRTASGRDSRGAECKRDACRCQGVFAAERPGRASPPFSVLPPGRPK